jgi:outer membrane protein, heavy metal efflux system
MRKKFWVQPSLLAAALVVSASGFAQQASTLEHPLRRGLEAAWAMQPEQHAAGLWRAAADAARRAAQQWTREVPTLELAGKTDQFHRNAGSREYGATLAVPLWLPGERARAQAAADAEGDALDARLAATRLSLAEQVRARYWEHARSSQELHLAEERSRHARELAQDVARRVHAGDLARADAYQAEGLVASAQAAVAQARAAADRAVRRWQTLTGFAPAETAEPGAEATPAETQTLAAHPELRALSAKVETARRQRDLASAQRFANPELSVGAVRERGGAAERYAPSIVVGVRIPLGASVGSTARMATASAELLEAETLLALQTQRLASEAASAQDEVRAREAFADAAERRAQLARETRGFFEKSFRAGETDLPTRLRIELEAFEAQRQAASSRLERSAAISSLRQALGLLPE